MESIKINFTRNLLRVQRNMSALLDEFFAQRKRRTVLSGLWYPSLDIYETPDALVILVELAGVNTEDISITVQANVMKIEGARKEFPCGDKVRLHQMEIDFGAFERTVEIGVPFVAEDITASYREGFLTVVIPKDQRHAGATDVVPG